MATHFGGFSSAGNTDCYGFAKPEDFDEKKYEQFIGQYLPVLARRSQRWESFVSVDESSTIPDSGFFAQRKLKRFIRKGIPSSMRPKMWMLLSGAQEKMQQFPSEFRRVSQSTLNEDVAYAIEIDLLRTFPDNDYFRNKPGNLTSELKMILSAFAAKNPHIGYCQGLNYLAGMLMLILKNQEHTFWLLHTIIYKLPDYYSRGMLGLRVDMAILRELVRQKAPDIDAHFTKLQFDPAMILTKWFVCWYLESLPIETVLRVWDCFFYEGPKILIRVALTLILKNRQRIAQCTNFANIIDLFKIIIHDPFALDCHGFMEAIFTLPGTLSSSSLDAMRVKFETEFKNEKRDMK